jgi:peptide/nickel transport system substrate-binding protein
MTLRKTIATTLMATTLLLSAGSMAMAETLHVAIQEDPDTLDPATGGTYGGRQVFAALCDKLVDIDAGLTITPMLATSWEWNDGSTALTLHLRDGVKFHDGTPFDAEAVKFNIERAKTLDESRRKPELASVETITVVDPLTVTFNLSKPDVTVLVALTDRAGMMISPTAAEAEGENFSAAPVCSGPFQFAERSQREFVRLTKFPDYWNAANVFYDEILYTYIEDATIRLARLQAGDIDVAERIAPTDIAAIEGNPELKVYSSPGLGTSYLSAGGRDTPYRSDVNVRKAFELSIDRNVINQVTYAGQYVADNQLEPNASSFHIAEFPVPARDLEAAKNILADAGHTSPVPVEITLANTLSDTRVGQIIQSMANEAGFQVTVLPLESSTAYERVFSGNFDVFLSNWSGRSDPHLNLDTLIGCTRPAVAEYDGWCSQEAEALMQQAVGESDHAKRYELYRQATEIYLGEVGVIPLYHPSWIYGASASLEGIAIYPDGIFRPTGVKPAS